MSFSGPFFGGDTLFGGSYAPTRQIPYTIALNGKPYVVDLPNYRTNGLPRLRQGVVTSGEPNDNLLNPEGSWWRSRFSWHLGSGQGIDELDPDSVSQRFDESRGIDPWTEFQACLLPATTEVLDVSTATLKMVSTGQYLYVSDGTTLQRSADLSVWTPITGLSGTINDLATDGTDCYVATSADMFTVGSTTTASKTSSAPAQAFDSVEFTSNRLVAGSGADLIEVKTSSYDVVTTHFQAAFRWGVIFAVGSRIYAGGFAGNRSELYSLTTTDVGDLALGPAAASFYEGELLQDALSYGGIVLLCTNKGLRLATVETVLTYGPLIDAPGSVLAVGAEGRFAWFGWENFPGAGTGVGRLALDEFVDTLLPPYATDVFTTDSNEDILAVARFDGRTVFAVANAGIYAASPTAYVTEGYVTSGDVTMGTVEDKLFTGLRTRFNELLANESVQAELYDVSDPNFPIASNNATQPGADESDIVIDSGPVARVETRHTLRGDGTTTPCLTEWRLRGIPIAPGVQEWLVPLVISSRVVVNDSQGQHMSINPWERVNEIRKLWQESKVVLYEEGDQIFRVRIDNFQIDATRWRDGSDWLEVQCTVRLLSA